MYKVYKSIKITKNKNPNTIFKSNHVSSKVIFSQCPLLMNKTKSKSDAGDH